jgi:hypothetical protein
MHFLYRVFLCHTVWLLPHVWLHINYLFRIVFANLLDFSKRRAVGVIISIEVFPCQLNLIIFITIFLFTAWYNLYSCLYILLGIFFCQLFLSEFIVDFKRLVSVNLLAKGFLLFDINCNILSILVGHCLMLCHYVLHT